MFDSDKKFGKELIIGIKGLGKSDLYLVEVGVGVKT